tara:strand:- start:287 stop:454 length:168 start_codon:yes stop_codon:yes gene_type:complete
MNTDIDMLWELGSADVRILASRFILVGHSDIQAFVPGQGLAIQGTSEHENTRRSG